MKWMNVMRRNIKSALAAASALAGLAFAGMAAAEPIIVDHVTVIDGTGRPALSDQTVVIDGGRFTEVVPSSAAAGLAGHRIDGRGKYLIPGLMDIHIHLAGVTRGADGQWVVDRKVGEAALASFLYAGVTSVLDVGNQTQNILPLRAAERAGTIPAPHVFATGNLVTYPGSHGTNMAVNVTSWPEAEAALTKQVTEQQPDVQKITYDDEGWGSRPMIPILPKDLLQHIIEFYNLHGVRTTIHISNESRALEAIYSGVDSLAHTPVQGPVTDAFVKMAAAKQIPMATTMSIGDRYSRVHDHPEYLDQPLYAATTAPEERARMKALAASGGETALSSSKALYQETWRKWMQLMEPILMDNIRRIDAAGGVMALGTDLSNGAETQHEMELLSKAGVPNLQIIKIATLNGARLLGKQEQMGSIERGKIADAVLLSADPTKDINNAKSIVFVMKAGEIIDESKLPLAGGPQPRRMQ